MKSKVFEILTPKQKRFCDEYLIDRNATRAALLAGYSRETALSGYLMTVPKIICYLDEQMEHVAREAQVSHAQVLRELCKIAFGNMSNYFDNSGGIKPMDALSEDDKAALWSVSVSDAGSGTAAGAAAVTKFRMYNKLSALDKIAKHINFYKAQTDEPKVIYKYVTTKDIEDDDLFDDPKLKQEIEKFEKWEEEKTQELRGKNQEGEESPGDGKSESPEETVEGVDASKGEISPYMISLDETPEALMERMKRIAETQPINIEVDEPLVVITRVAEPGPNYASMGLSGMKISPEERARRRKQVSYWMGR